VAGRVGGELVDVTFAPALSFDVGDLRLQPSFESGGVGPFAPRESGTGTRAVAAEMSLGALSLTVPTTADLVLGTAAANPNLRGMNGDDCILGGGGDDVLRGDGGTDVCIGGPGTDTFHATCETQIQ
jgi:Ca2+-binding RTX toxin-like protein